MKVGRLIIDKFKWDLSKLVKDEDHYEDLVQEAKDLIKRLKDLEDNFIENIKDYLETYEKAHRIVANIMAYSKMKHDEDTRLDYGQKITLEADDLYNYFQKNTSSLRPNILSIDKDKLEDLIKDQDLEDYRLFIERIYRYKDHTLRENEEEILKSMGFLQSAPQTSYNLLTNADIEFEDMTTTDGQLNHANYISYLMSEDPKVREEAFFKYYKSYKKISNTLSSLYTTNVRAISTEASLRNFESARHMELFADDVDTQVYDNLVEVVRDNLPGLHKYYRLKKDHIGLESQHMYDTYLPIVEPKVKDIPYDEAREIIIKALAPMGDDYVDKIKEAFDSNWIHVYPNQAKTSGAYSYGTYDSDPYILLNYDNNYNSMFTLAHELGHSIHSYYSRDNNDYLYSGYSIFVAEVASTTSELLLLNYLLGEAEDVDEKIYLIDHYIDSFKSTVFRQTMFAEFEKMTHEKIEAGESLTLKDYSDIYYKLNEDYFGDSVVVDEDIAIEWARIPHFYRDFYVYKYATGFISAVKLSQDILTQDESKLQAYKEFLKDGSKHFPLDQLRSAGVDLSKKETMEESMQVFNNLIEELENLIK